MSSDDDQTLEDRIVGPPAEGKECGECVACCKLLTIDQEELKKPADVLCEHSTGKGCGIYESRPAVCRTWYCVWRRIPSMPIAARPDRMRVMFELVRPQPAKCLLSKLYIRGQALDSWADFEQLSVQHAVAMFARAKIPVWFDHAGTMSMVHPSQDIARVLLDGLPPATAQIAAEAEEWRAIYEGL